MRYHITGWIYRHLRANHAKRKQHINFQQILSCTTYLNTCCYLFPYLIMLYPILNLKLRKLSSNIDPTIKYQKIRWSISVCINGDAENILAIVINKYTGNYLSFPAMNLMIQVHLIYIFWLRYLLLVNIFCWESFQCHNESLNNLTIKCSMREFTNFLWY